MNDVFSSESRPQHQVLIDEFMALDTEVQGLVEKFVNGKIIYECIPPEGAPDYKTLFDKIVERFVAAQDYAKQLIEKRNAKLQEAQSAMRAVVMASQETMRGPDGKSSGEKYGPFEVNSKTLRGFDAKVLFDELGKVGMLSRLKELTFVDKNTGDSMPAVQEKVEVKYEPVKNWLRENNLEQILDTAYEEEEGTPAVTGPKPVAWLGSEDKKAKGKK